MYELRRIIDAMRDFKRKGDVYWGAIRRILFSGVVCMPFMLAFGVAEAQGPSGPIGPIVFEKPNSSRFEVIWFHGDFHNQVLGNLSNPERYFSPYEVDNEGIVCSELALKAPFAVYRVSAYLDTVDVSEVLPGDQFTPLDLQLTSERNDVVWHPTDIEFALPVDFASGGLVSVYPELSFSSGDSLFVGFQWGKGTPSAPMIGAAANFGSLIDQEYVYRKSGINNWSSASDIAGVEIEILDWRADAGSLLGYGSRGYRAEQPHFLIWYASDTLKSFEDATSSAVISSDSLSWESALASGGYVSIVAEDDAGFRSDTSHVKVPWGAFKKITLSVPHIDFDWRKPLTLKQDIFITNEGIGPVNLQLVSDDSRVVLSESSLFLSGGRFKVVTIEMLEPPVGEESELHSLYIFNDSGWTPLKVDIHAIADIQTSVDDETVVPLSFEVSEIYPNPNYGSAQMRMVSPQGKVFKFEVYNVLGQLLQSEERQVIGEAQIPIVLTARADLPLAAGVYFVRVSSGEESTMRKMVFVK